MEYYDDEILSGDDIETLDDLEVWNRFINENELEENNNEYEE